jgi:DNA (cytosine-5)-methyltransferase 1
MDYNDLLVSIFDETVEGRDYSTKLKKDVLDNIEIIANDCLNLKAIFTVLVTLFIYKIKHPKQDIRLHRAEFQDGFSGRTFDTKYITPTLKQIGLPSMAESGWLTRTLERSEPFNLNYSAKIRKPLVKESFLQLINSVEINKVNPKFILVELFKQVIKIQKENRVEIKPLVNPDKLSIQTIIDMLDRQFTIDYKTSYGSKLPVLAFYAIYQIILNEVSRYDGCSLKNLGSRTASDRTSKSSGDIEIFKNSELFEAVEIKLNKVIDANILRIAKEKIIRHNPRRYYILSYNEIAKDDEKTIYRIIQEVKDKHGCQIIVNGVIPTLKYYLRLISDLELFYKSYSQLIAIDTELKPIHKKVWNKLTEELNNEL